MRFRFIYLLLVVLLVVSACGQRDQYTVGEPESAHAVAFSKTMTLQNLSIPLVANYFVSYKLAAWDSSRILVGTSRGITEITPEGLKNTSWPYGHSVEGLVCLDDGTAWAADNSCSVYFWNGTDWSLDNVWDSCNFVDLKIDSQNRPILIGRLYGSAGSSGVVFRKENFDWQQLTPADFPEIQSAAVGPDDILYVVDKQLELRYETGSDWAISETIDLSEISQIYSLNLVGDSSGNLVLWDRKSSLFWIKEGESWTRFEPTDFCENSQLFWTDNQLYGSFGCSSRGLCRWDLDHWELISEFPDNFDATRQVKQLGDMLLLVSNNDELWKYVAGSFTRILPKMNHIHAAAIWQGQVHVIAGDGAHFLVDEDGWYLVGFPFGECFGYDVRTMFVDDTGMLTLVESQSIVHWDGTSYSSIGVEPGIEDAFLQHDKSALIAGRRRYGVLKNGTFEWVGDFHPDWLNSPSLSLGSSGCLWMLDSPRLGYVQDGEAHYCLTFTSSSCFRMAYVPESGLFLLKSNAVLNYYRGVWSDITPASPVDSEIGSEFSDLKFDDYGRILIPDANNDALCIYDAGQWTRLSFTQAKSDPLLIWLNSSPQIDSDNSGNMLVWNRDTVTTGNSQGVGE